MEPTKVIFLIRHASTELNEAEILQGLKDVSISTRGILQAEALADSLKNEPIEVIYHSPLKRALETSDIINRHHDVPLVVEKNFFEIDLGDWELQNFRDVLKDKMDFYTKWSQDPGIKIPGGESFQQVYDRIIPGVSRVLDSSERVIVIVGHATVNRAIAASLLNIPPQTARSFRIANCGYGKFFIYQYNGYRRTVLDSWNITAHLEG